MPRKPPQEVERTATGPVRCAIYTRKSSEEGLEQPFNSLDAQREAAEAYIASQRHQGWIALPERYDDGGYSGGNMERPALQCLLASLQAGGIDCLVVYKVDRLSRSLLDFARIMGVLEQRGTSFVSITQQFNTTSSIGRLTLNVLLSFAQFEREFISERTRDKMSAARRKGKWVGGIPPRAHARNVQRCYAAIKKHEAKDRKLDILLVHGSGRSSFKSLAHEFSNSQFLLKSAVRQFEGDEKYEITRITLPD